MYIGMGIPIVKQIKSGSAASFDPLSLSPLAYYSPAGPFFSDAAGLTQVTTDGSMVRIWNDISGNARHMIAPSSSARATLRVSGGFTWLELDGVDDEYGVSTPTWLNGLAGLTVASRCFSTSANSGQFGLQNVCTSAAGTAAISRFALRFNLQKSDFMVASLVAFPDVLSAADITLSVWHTLLGKFNATPFELRTDGTEVTGGSSGTTINTTVGTSLGIGNEVSATRRLAGSVAAVIIVPSYLSGTDLSNLETYLGSITP